MQDLMNANEMIGGVNVVVEIDESKFGKRKFNKGKRVNGKWVFGGLKERVEKFLCVWWRTGQPTRCYMPSRRTCCRVPLLFRTAGRPTIVCNQRASNI